MQEICAAILDRAPVPPNEILPLYLSLSPNDRRFKILEKHIQREGIYNRHLLRTCRTAGKLYEGRWVTKSAAAEFRARDALEANHSLLSRFREGKIALPDVEQFFRLKKRSPFSITDYSLHAVAAGGGGYESTGVARVGDAKWRRPLLHSPNGQSRLDELPYTSGFNLQIDGLVGLVLCYKDQPVYKVSGMATGTDDFTVQQMQGQLPVRRDKSGEALLVRDPAHSDWLNAVHLPWRSMMQAVGALVKDLNFSTLRICSAENNPWTADKFSDDGPHFPLERAVKIYNETAESLRFARASDRNWERSLPLV